MPWCVQKLLHETNIFEDDEDLSNANSKLILTSVATTYLEFDPAQMLDALQLGDVKSLEFVVQTLRKGMSCDTLAGTGCALLCQAVLFGREQVV